MPRKGTACPRGSSMPRKGTACPEEAACPEWEQHAPEEAACPEWNACLTIFLQICGVISQIIFDFM
jgi:hypothetical protein